MEKFEIIKAKEDFTLRLNNIKDVIKFDTLDLKIKELELIMLQDDFWTNQKETKKVINQLNVFKEQKELVFLLQDKLEEISIVLELDDESLYADCENRIKSLNKEIEQFENELLLNDEFDSKNAIIELHPGAGGTESQDWALMLYRMYKRYTEKNHYQLELIDYQEASDAGIKSVTFLVSGKYAYGMLKGEAGVHRLVRISPFDSSARRHTSFASCNVIPEFDSDIEIEIADEELRIDTYRASGAGGQHINKTDSAVRITHLPTGIVVCSQSQRSQIQNREKAMTILKSRLYQLEREKQEQQKKSMMGELADNGFGSQIRSYILHPYALVKDHRTNYESNQPQSVLDGDLDGFISSYLKWTKMEKNLWKRKLKILSGLI